MAASDDPSPLDLARVAAAGFGGGDWQLDAEPDQCGMRNAECGIEDGTPSPSAPPAPAPTGLIPNSEFRIPQSKREEPPPSPEQIVEAMLFAGGPPLTAATACGTVRGLTPDAFREAVDRLAKKYRDQRRPYAVRPSGDGFVLAVRAEYRGLKERLTGGPREARLAPPALDVLSLVAYRQPVAKPEVDALRGADSGGPLRQLVRLGLVAVARKADGEVRGEARYATTPRFLELFGLSSLDDLPRIAD